MSINSKNSDLLERLNVASVPFGHIYYSGNLVGEMKITKNNWNVFETAVKHIVQGYCNLDELEVVKSLPL